MNDSPQAYKPSMKDRIQWKINDMKRLFEINVMHKLIMFLGGVPADFSGNIQKHAKRELPGLKPGADKMDKLMADQLLQLLAVFSSHGHSGASAPFAIRMFEKLANYQPLGPLTGDDDEWTSVNDFGDDMKYQNLRASHVFKGSDGRAYDINGKVFRDPDGNCYTSGDSRVYIEFPYTPVKEYVDVPADD